MTHKRWTTLVILCAVALISGCSSQTIWQAAASGDQDEVDWVLFWNPKLINQLDQEKQWTPLQHAIANSYGDMAALLLEKGADPNATSWDGRTARGFAVEVKNDIMRQFILDHIDETIVRREEEAESAIAGVDAQSQ